MLLEKSSSPINFVTLSHKGHILSKKDEFDLINKWQTKRDKKALEKIFKSYLRLVVSIGRRNKNYGLSLDDLIQEGILGLIQAIDKFDIKKNFRLSTYATWWIKAMIQSYILKNWSIVKIGSTASQKALFFNLKKIKKKIIGDSSYEYLGENEIILISSMMSVNPRDVKNIESRISCGDTSLNQNIDEDNNNELISLLADDTANQEEVVENYYDNKLKKELLNYALDKLKYRERLIIKARKFKEKSYTLDKLALELEISKERVRQIEQTALAKLQKIILAKSKQPKEFFIN